MAKMVVKQIQVMGIFMPDVRYKQVHSQRVWSGTSGKDKWEINYLDKFKKKSVLLLR